MVERGGIMSIHIHSPAPYIFQFTPGKLWSNKQSRIEDIIDSSKT